MRSLDFRKGPHVPVEYKTKRGRRKVYIPGTELSLCTKEKVVVPTCLYDGLIEAFERAYEYRGVMNERIYEFWRISQIFDASLVQDS